MSLIVETGNGLENAESYASVTDANTRIALRGDAAWGALDTEQKERALRRATDFMTANYRARWSGGRVSQNQSLDWPRSGVIVDGFAVPSTVVPADVVRACIDLAIRASTSDLLPDLDAGSNQIKVDKTGPLETEYFQNNVDPQARFLAVDALLAPYFGTAGSGSGSIRLVRA